MNYFSMPTTANFELTHFCNAKCIFCSIKNKEISFSTINKMKKIVDILKKNGILRLNLFGGEPFIYPDISELLKYASQQNFFISGVTNALSIEDKIIEDIIKYMDVIGISIHGLEKTHDKFIGVKNSFKHSIKIIKMLSEKNFPVGINMTITKKNYLELIPLVEFLQQNFKIKFVALNRFIRNPFLNEKINEELEPNIEIFKKTLTDLKYLNEKFPELNCKYAIHFPFCIIDDKSLHKYIGDGCGFGQYYCAVDNEGNIKMCSYTNTILGNIFNDSLEEIWKNNKFLKDYRSENWIPNKCKTCDEFNLCKVGCKISAGKSFSKDSFLHHIKE